MILLTVSILCLPRLSDADRAWIDGVYKSGFATTQQAYEAAVVPLFNSLDRLEKMLTGKDYLVGDRLTEADIRLFVTIVRRPLPFRPFPFSLYSS